jgi:hypothetical protein
MPLLHANHYPESFTEESSSMEVSKIIFDRLTKLSSQLVLNDYELSPIQAWNYIANQSQAYRLQIEQLRTLAKNMLHHVKCHG